MPKKSLSGISVNEAGRRGGLIVKAKYGLEFYEEIGKKGGRVRAQSADILSGELGRKGAAARWGKKNK